MHHMMTPHSAALPRTIPKATCSMFSRDNEATDAAEHYNGEREWISIRRPPGRTYASLSKGNYDPHDHG